MSSELKAIAPGSAPALAAKRADQDTGASYREILKSSSLVGGSSLINVVMGIVRTKAMAVLLGPAGYGLMGAYLLIVELSRSVAQMGVNSSGVRQIAETASTDDLGRTARTAAVLRGTALASAVIGAAAVWLLAPVIAQFTFGDLNHTNDVALLSAVLFFSLIAGGQVALVQGMRRIADLSKIGILGSVFGTVASVGLVYWLRERGVVLSMIAVAALTVVTGWWYRRKIRLPRVRLSLGQALSESSALLKLGLAFLGSGLLTLGAAYVVRILLMRHSGLETAGLYQAAWTLGGMYVGFILQAMGTDFYPRLVAAAGSDTACNRLVNEQAKVSLLLAGPGVIATLTFASLVITLMYSPRFDPAVDMLRWICLGMATRVITWPMGYILVAKNKQALFFGTDCAWAIVNVMLTWLCVQQFGPVGAGIAFFGSYLFHGVMLYPIVRSLSGFRWAPDNLRIGLMFVASVGLVFVGFETLSPVVATCIGAGVTLGATVLSARALLRLGAPTHFPKTLLHLLRLRGLHP